jgi:hypothetical protein
MNVENARYPQHDPDTMPYQASIFPDDEPALPSTDPAPASTLALSALKFSAGQLSPSQKRFNQLLAQTETLARKIESTRNATDTHRALFASRIHRWRRARALMRQMALWLMGASGLTMKHKRIASEIISGLSASLAVQVMSHAGLAGRPAHSLADEERAATADYSRHGRFWRILGQGDTFESMDDLMRRHGKMNASRAAHKSPKKNAMLRNAKRKKPGSSRRKNLLPPLQDADGALRTVPPAPLPRPRADPQEHIRKTALMKEANVAYERRDLLAFCSFNCVPIWWI